MLKEKFNLTGKVALVTGAGQGIGKAYAEALAEFGANLVIADINFERAERVASEIADTFKVDAIALYVDVASTTSVKQMIADTLSHFGKLDIAVNNAGIASAAGAEEMSDEMFDAVIRVNLRGTFICCREEAKVMMKNGGGSIINQSSMAGVIVNRPEKISHYRAAKTGVITLTKSYASEWAEYNIRVNCISPGHILTPMNQRDDVKHLHQIWKDNHIPMKRMATPDELGGAVVYLASEASSFVTGHNLIVDGGCCIW